MADIPGSFVGPMFLLCQKRHYSSIFEGQDRGYFSIYAAEWFDWTWDWRGGAQEQESASEYRVYPEIHMLRSTPATSSILCRMHGSIVSFTISTAKVWIKELYFIITPFSISTWLYYLLSCYTDPVDPRMPDEKEKSKAALTLALTDQAIVEMLSSSSYQNVSGNWNHGHKVENWVENIPSVGKDVAQLITIKSSAILSSSQG